VGARVSFLRRLLIVLVITGIAAVLAAAFSNRQSTRKVATATLVFAQPRPDMQIVASSFSNGDTSSQLVPNDNAAIVGSDDMKRITAGKLGMRVADVRNAISVSSQQSSHVVTIKASRPSAAQAAQLANTYMNVVVTQQRAVDRRRARAVIGSLQAQLAAMTRATRSRTITSTGATNKVSSPGDTIREAIAAETSLARNGSGSPEIAQTASPSDTSSSPNTTRNVLFGALFGLVLGIGIAGLAGASRGDDDDQGPYNGDGRGRFREPERRRVSAGV
jgi:capsular polysaccharide biosynthesis protein